jgi:hypothetical protein
MPIIRTCLMVALAMVAMACTHSPPHADQTGIPRGEEVSAKLNERYDDVRSSCDGFTAAYFCSGVIIRSAGFTTDYHFWNPNPNDEYMGVSFSYLRRDTGERDLYGEEGIGVSGYILAPADRWGKADAYPLSAVCSYPYDALTDIGRGVFGCDASQEYPTQSGSCTAQGIVTVEAFATHYLSAAQPDDPAAFRKRALHQCSFATDPFSFELSILARQGGSLEIEHRRHNELMLMEWPQDIPASLPIEAIFFDGSSLGLERARFSRFDFQRATGIELPIIRFSQDVRMPPFSCCEQTRPDHAHALAR